MREDGTVLPKQVTGLCSKQQRRIERCVMQVCDCLVRVNFVGAYAVHCSFEFCQG